MGQTRLNKFALDVVEGQLDGTGMGGDNFLFAVNQGLEADGFGGRKGDVGAGSAVGAVGNELDTVGGLALEGGFKLGGGNLVVESLSLGGFTVPLTVFDSLVFGVVVVCLVVVGSLGAGLEVGGGNDHSFSQK